MVLSPAAAATVVGMNACMHLRIQQRKIVQQHRHESHPQAQTLFAAGLSCHHPCHCVVEAELCAICSPHAPTAAALLCPTGCSAGYLSALDWPLGVSGLWTRHQTVLRCFSHHAAEAHINSKLMTLNGDNHCCMQVPGFLQALLGSGGCREGMIPSPAPPPPLPPRALNSRPRLEDAWPHPVFPSFRTCMTTPVPHPSAASCSCSSS